MKQLGYLAKKNLEENTITGVVVGTTLEDQGTPQAEDYWIRVVFLDGTKSTLFHDEVEVIGTQEDKSERT